MVFVFSGISYSCPLEITSPIPSAANNLSLEVNAQVRISETAVRDNIVAGNNFLYFLQRNQLSPQGEWFVNAIPQYPNDSNIFSGMLTLGRPGTDFGTYVFKAIVVSRRLSAIPGPGTSGLIHERDFASVVSCEAFIVLQKTR